jgi:PAS domain S-box-containing protein
MKHTKALSKKTPLKTQSIRELELELQESTVFYKHLTELTPEALVIHSEGKIIFVNPIAVKLIGAKSSKEIIGMPIKNFLHPDSLAIAIERIQKIMENKKVAQVVEEKFVNFKGEIITAEVKSVLFPFHGKIAILSIIHDITENKKAQERKLFLETASNLLISSLSYETTLKNITDLIVPFMADYCRIAIFDEGGSIQEIAAKHSNPKKVNLVEKLYKEYQGRTNVTYGIEAILQTGKAELITKLGQQYLTPLKDNKNLLNIVKELELKSYMGIPLRARGKIIGAMTFSSIREGRYYTKDDLSFAQELGHLIALALDNTRLFSNEQKAVSLRDDFISLASHELKTPITSLKMYVQLLERQFKESGYESYFKKIDDQLNKLTALIGDLLNVSKLQHGKLEFHKESFALNEVVTEAIEIMQGISQKHTIIVEGDINKKVLADRYRIYQVLTNLLTNAIKYSPKARKVLVKLQTEKNHVKLSVQDFGIGISPQHQQKIFEQFYRVSTPEEKTYPGLGMGLFIAKEIIQNHGGTIWVESKKGKGSKFTFTLPYNK